MIDLRVPQRQSPLAIVFLGIRLLRSIGLAQLAIAALFLFRATLSGPLIVLPFLAILLFGAYSAAAWWRYTFQLVDGDLIVVKGVLRVDRLTVPVDRIQSLAIDQELLHRMTSLVKVSVDTAGSAEAEFAIDAISRPIAEELQRLTVTAGQRPSSGHAPAAHSDAGELTTGPPPPLVDEDQIVLTHDLRRLVRSALTMWPLTGLIILGPLFAFADQFSRRLSDEFGDIDVSPSRIEWWWLPIAATGFVTLSIVLNITRVILQDWQLTLRANPTSLRRTSGLLSRTSKASSVARIQVVTSEQNLLQRRSGLRGVRLSTIGEGDLSLAGCDDRQFDIVRELAGSSSTLALERRAHRAEIFLAVRNTTIAMTLLAAASWIAVGWWSLLAFAVVPAVWLTRRRHVQTFRWGLGSELSSTTDVISFSTRQAQLRKTNAVRVTQSIFERRRGLGHVHLVTAAGTISIGMIPISEANDSRDKILAAAETDPRPWM